MKHLLFISSLLLSGCAAYNYTHVDADGSSTALTIYSMREVEAGALNIDKSGALTGSADKLGANEKLIDAANNLIKRIPMTVP